MRTQTLDQHGSAMVLAIVVLAVIAVIALVVVSISSSEKWTQFANYTQSRAFYSADAAGEAGVNWIRTQPSPPDILDANNRVFVAGGFTALSSDHQYKYDVQFVRARFRPGWSLEYKDYEYMIEADGISAKQSEAAIEVRAVRVFREGY